MPLCARALTLVVGCFKGPCLCGFSAPAGDVLLLRVGPFGGALAVRCCGAVVRALPRRLLAQVAPWVCGVDACNFFFHKYLFLHFMQHPAASQQRPYSRGFELGACTYMQGQS